MRHAHNSSTKGEEQFPGMMMAFRPKSLDIKEYKGNELGGGNRAWASRLWYTYRHTMWPAVKKPTITHSALKPSDPTRQSQQADGQDFPQVPKKFPSFALQTLSQLLGSGCCGNLLIRVAR
ncbi:hypothetical protein EYF80_025797 [Liparis tanakae]|uniref:Uncharacterized protein n=1 Tax=Liparis tanakae TaxID=230148 RepID=A0A4Z2HF86_9TELE|nr:hypothetical protein EYF80_025797 [Liparis tanakae]